MTEGNAQPGGKNGSKRHLLVDARGAPLSLIATAANRHDVSQLEAVLVALTMKCPSPPCRRHQHLCADAAYSGAPAAAVMAREGAICLMSEAVRRKSGSTCATHAGAPIAGSTDSENCWYGMKNSNAASSR